MKERVFFGAYYRLQEVNLILSANYFMPSIYFRIFIRILLSSFSPSRLAALPWLMEISSI